MNEDKSDKKIWKYIGLMAVGAIGMYQLIKGQETWIYTVLTILIIICFVKYYKD
ncbi:hypothetical protein [Pedobacter sp. MW01-1-1]|uniref:hypothetical protein n=1 Tax=Pedobacter sp. MW01-1-1 TaxID=3383027 RepID=UPI003FF109B4